jgi:hypothetical protein
MTQKLLCFFLLFVTIKATSQTLSFKTSKPYSATKPWDFLCENYALTGIANVQIAKTENGGLLKLAVETTNTSYTISGMVYVFLTDNTIIRCSDKAMREVSDNKIISYYRFSPVEMNKLKTTEIQSIHFNIKGNSQGFNSQVGNFTAVNRKQYFTTAFDKAPKTYNTIEEIKALYK